MSSRATQPRVKSSSPGRDSIRSNLADDRCAHFYTIRLPPLRTDLRLICLHPSLTPSRGHLAASFHTYSGMQPPDSSAWRNSGDLQTIIS
ncbi:hypothetical protein TNCV_730561 [Trichonephila clavipes]|nr:hypothetical protein TNCV_730561 [Trichonephila clavipes]